MQKYTLSLVGDTPLVMHSDRLADPLDEYTQAVAEVSKKQKKTLADHEELAKREFLGGLYYDAKDGVHLPSENLLKCLVEAARRHKEGKNIERGITIDEVRLPLSYNGPDSPEGLWADPSFRYRKSVGVGQKRVMRTRPMFAEWAVEATLVVDENVVDGHRLAQIAEEAGRYIGVCERRPMFGKFTATLDRAA